MAPQRRQFLLGTRGSPLALAQSQWVADQLVLLNPGLDIQLKQISTSGDRIQNRFLNDIGGKGLFVKEIEEALLKNEIDLAVHSLKDMPAVLPEGLRLGAMPAREDPQDVLLSREGTELSTLKSGAVIGTTSLRRRLQIQRKRPDLKFEMLRGNIDTRVGRLKNGDFDAIVLAKAGMKRLGIAWAGTVDLEMIPAPGQGTLAIEAREHDEEVQKILAPFNHEPTRIASEAERFVMRALGGSCNLPMGAFGKIEGEQFHLKAFIASPDGREWIEEEISGSTEEAMKIAERLVEEFWKQGARGIVEEIEKLIT